MNEFLSLLLCLALALCIFGVYMVDEEGTEAPALPEPGADFYYYDAAQVMDYDTKAMLCSCNVELYEATGAQIVVAAIPGTKGMPINEYTTCLYNYWGVGSAELNNGFLLLLAIDDDNYFCGTGSGIDDVFTDELISELLYEYLEPDFAAKNYSAGIQRFFKALYDRVCDYYAFEPGGQGEIAAGEAA